MVDPTAFYKLSYGLYLIGSNDGGRHFGCVANTVQQVTSDPLQMSVTLNKQNATTQAILNTGRFTVVVLAEAATMELIGTFGFYSSTERDKFEDFEVGLDDGGHPYVDEQGVARFSVCVKQHLDVGTHIIFVGEVEEAALVSDEPPMTYAYYHQVKGGKTPPKASSYLNNAEDGSSMAANDGATGSVAGQPMADAGEGATPKIAWRCTICGHIEYVEELPDDFMCPICGAGKDFFEKITV